MTGELWAFEQYVYERVMGFLAERHKEPMYFGDDDSYGGISLRQSSTFAFFAPWRETTSDNGLGESERCHLMTFFYWNKRSAADNAVTEEHSTSIVWKKARRGPPGPTS